MSRKATLPDKYFCLSEDQEHAIYRVQSILEFVASLADACGPKATPQVPAEGMSSLYGALAAMLPSPKEMPFVIEREEGEA